MLSTNDMIYIRELTNEYWKNEVRTSDFIKLAQGKEIGHKIGDIVDEKTTSLLKNDGKYKIFHQMNNGHMASRSMGDFWIEAGGIYNPVNIKAGEYGKNGQPNLVSLKRVLSALVNCVIDSYYLLIMKISHAKGNYVPYVYFVDMLDFIDYTTYNSGPGQMMLKESQFYPVVDRLYLEGSLYSMERKTIPEKIDRLYSMLDSADTQLYLEREKKRKEIKEQVFNYELKSDKMVSRYKQREFFNLGTDET